MVVCDDCTCEKHPIISSRKALIDPLEHYSEREMERNVPEELLLPEEQQTAERRTTEELKEERKTITRARP